MRALRFFVAAVAPLVFVASAGTALAQEPAADAAHSTAPTPASASPGSPGATGATGSAASAGAVRTYVARRGDTCSKIVRQFYGSEDYLDFFHQANGGMGPAPHHLVPGTVFKLPPPPAVLPRSPDARLTWLRNLVEAWTPERHPGRRDEELMRGHRVSTLAESSAEVTFFDESRMQLGEHTLIVILGDDPARARAGAADTTLLSGALRAHLAELAGSPGAAPRARPLATPAARVEMEPGEAQVSVDARRSTRLAVYRGRSRMKAAGKQVTVNRNYGSRTDLGSAPTPPRPLPSPPSWSARPPGVLLLPGGKGELQAAWQAGPERVEGARAAAPARWHLQVAHDERFNDLVLDGQLDLQTVALRKELAEAGPLFARVSAIDDDQFEGPFSTATETRAVVAKVVPGRPARMELPDGLFCGVDGGPLAPTVGGALTLPPGPSHAVRCASTAEGAGAGEVRVEVPVDPAPAPSAPPPAPAGSPAPDGAAAASPSPAGAAAASPPLPIVRLEGALMATLRAGDDLQSGSLGPGAALDLGVAVRLGRGALTAAARAGFEAYPGDHSTLSLALPIGYRFVADKRVHPYLAVVPELVFEHTGLRGDGYALKRALGGLLGLEVNLGRGALFLELGYERRSGQQPDHGDLPDGSFTGALGYRLHLTR